MDLRPNTERNGGTVGNRRGTMAGFAQTAFLAISIPCIITVLIIFKIIPDDYMPGGGQVGVVTNIDSAAEGCTDPGIKQPLEDDIPKMMEPSLGAVYADTPKFDELIELESKGDPFKDLSFVDNRNGEAEHCGQPSLSWPNLSISIIVRENDTPAIKRGFCENPVQYTTDTDAIKHVIIYLVNERICFTAFV